MRFIQRSLMGLFLLAMTLGVLAMAGSQVFNAVEESRSQEERRRPTRERVFTVNVRTIEAVTAQPKITAFGEVRSRRTLELRAQSAGTIIELSPNFVEGGRLAEGDFILQIDPANAQSALDVAATELAEAEAEVEEANAALGLAKDELTAAQSQTALRRAALERQENLLQRGVGTEAAVESAALAHSSSEQAVLGKRQSLAQANARINRAQTALARREIALSEAGRRLTDTRLTAEFGGVLSGVSAVQGGLVGNNEKIGSLIDPTALEVVFRVSNTQFGRLNDANGTVTNAQVLIRLDMLGAEIVTNGSIERVSAAVGEGQTGRQLFAGIPEADASAFRPGDFVTVEIEEPLLENVSIIPATAADAAGNVLLLGENERLETAQVEVLRRQGDGLIVRAGDIIGREIVEERSPLLGDGIRVVTVRQTQAGVAAAKPVEPAAPELVELSEERRAKLVAFVEGNKRMPAQAKERILAQLKEPKVPNDVVERLESRMGG